MPDANRTIGVIPARIGSTRFPRKMLAEIGGRPLIEWVVLNARQATRLDRVLVATDDADIAAAVAALDVEPVMTRPDHPSGTDRIAEAVAGLQADIVVNIQGDEPLLDPALIDELVAVLEDDPVWDMATAAFPMASASLQNPAAVKVVFAEDGRALYFSRSPIPFVRDAEPSFEREALYWHHMGIYAYRVAFLRQFVSRQPALLERAEKLEQLRALAMGARIHVLKTACGAVGVDTPEDLDRVRALLKAAGRLQEEQGCT
jgi:3-deoxy-D-manno-octulosonate cytidylyltransferase